MQVETGQCMEEWREIPGFGGKYLVSSKGRVKNGTTNFVINSTPFSNSGYYQVNLTLDNSKQKLFYIHRLVAQAFIPNTANLEQVNHKDGDKLNNQVDNLEWVSRRDNAIHSRDILKNNQGCCVDEPVRCIETGQIYSSAAEAGRQTGINNHGITVVANGGTSRHTAGGYHWEYLDRKPRPYTPKGKFQPPHFAYKIKCIETGKVYNSSHEAAEKTNGCQTSIARAAREPHRTSGGFHWKRVDKIPVDPHRRWRKR